MALDRRAFRKRYSQLAGIYDPGMLLYRAAGLRMSAYRKAAVATLDLKPGDTAVDLGCGTGLNFPYLQDAVGSRGQIVGVDLTPPMLAQARQRVDRLGWANVVLVESDMAAFDLPSNARGVIATLAFATVPDYGDVIAKIAASLEAGARIANVELQWPDSWPVWLARSAALLNRPTGVTPDIVRRRPATAIERCFEDVETRNVYFGAAYICSGSAPARR